MSLPKTFSLKAAEGKTVQIPSIGFGTWASGEISLHSFGILQANIIQVVLDGAKMPLLKLSKQDTVILIVLGCTV